MLVSDRLPPHDINAEESVLGSILINSEAYIAVSNILKIDDFYREKINGFMKQLLNYLKEVKLLIRLQLQMNL